mgnify:CR=1 FL=1
MYPGYAQENNTVLNLFEVLFTSSDDDRFYQWLTCFALLFDTDPDDIYEDYSNILEKQIQPVVTEIPVLAEYDMEDLEPGKGPNWVHSRFLIYGDYYQTNDTDISWKVAVPKNLECNGVPCYNESMRQNRICNPVFVPLEENFLQLSSISSDIVWVYFLSLWAWLVFTEMLELGMKQQTFLVTKHGNKAGLAFFTIAFSAILFYLLHQRVDRDLFCLMNMNDTLCKNHQRNCFGPDGPRQNLK